MKDNTEIYLVLLANARDVQPNGINEKKHQLVVYVAPLTGNLLIQSDAEIRRQLSVKESIVGGESPKASVMLIGVLRAMQAYGLVFNSQTTPIS